MGDAAAFIELLSFAPVIGDPVSFRASGGGALEGNKDHRNKDGGQNAHGDDNAPSQIRLELFDIRSCHCDIRFGREVGQGRFN